MALSKLKKCMFCGTFFRNAEEHAKLNCWKKTTPSEATPGVTTPQTESSKTNTQNA